MLQHPASPTALRDLNAAHLATIERECTTCDAPFVGDCKPCTEELPREGRYLRLQDRKRAVLADWIARGIITEANIVRRVA